MEGLFDFVNQNVQFWLEPQAEKMVLMLGINPIHLPPQNISLPIGSGWIEFEYIDTVKNQAVYRATQCLLDRAPKHNPNLLELNVQEMIRLMP